jgi:hypothetical protein
MITITNKGGAGMPAEGFTVVVCQADRCCNELALMPALRAAVRASAHGVLISSGCTVGTLTCRPRAVGPVVLVQPCDLDRRPVGAAVHVGPLQTRSDVADLVSWLRAGDLDVGALPWWLRFENTRRLALHN